MTAHGTCEQFVHRCTQHTMLCFKIEKGEGGAASFIELGGEGEMEGIQLSYLWPIIKGAGNSRRSSGECDQLEVIN